MSKINIYKPRYKISFLAKSKVWPYKNSRLRRFYNIRGRKLIRGGLFKRYFMVFNNMKWAIARRSIRPYMQRRRAIRRRYRDMFYTKQQLKNFYGKQKETQFAHFFKKYLNNIARRNLAFASTIERRVDITLFRLRFLPTIYACQQFIHHYGISVNDRVENSPHALLKAGDLITFDTPIWTLFFNYLWERIHWRSYGLYLWRARQYKNLKKKIWFLKKDRRFKTQNTLFLKKIFKLFGSSKARILQIKKFEVNFKNKLLHVYWKNIKAKNTSNSKTILAFWKIYLDVLNEFKVGLKEIANKLTFFYQKRWRFKKWKWQYYYRYFVQTTTLLVLLYKHLKNIELKLNFLEYSFYKYFVEVNFSSKIKEKENQKRILEQKYLEEKFLTSSNLKSKIETLAYEISFLKKQKNDKLFQISKYEELKASEYYLWMEKLTFFMKLVLRRRIKLFSLKPKLILNKKTNRIVLRKSRLKLYMAVQRKKSMRKLSIPRLKPIHWYIPHYLYFDVTTLSAVYLYAPQPNEINYSFKCSLKNIYSFYRSRGY